MLRTTTELNSRSVDIKLEPALQLTHSFKIKAGHVRGPYRQHSSKFNELSKGSCVEREGFG